MGQGGPETGVADPEEAFRILRENPSARLVDVRTRAEWSFVGLPDLSSVGLQVWPVEWVSFPAMQPNPAFLDELRALAERDGGETPDEILFLCRSGVRSLAAARLVAGAWAGDPRLRRCTNVAEGFEGDLDAESHRGRLNGWKARGLPWRQG